MITLYEWGVVSESGILGGGWFDGCTDARAWPMRYKTRREARNTARALNTKYAYLRWRFQAVPLIIEIR